jgi:hypothetical protein
MQSFKTLLWVILAVILAIPLVLNWTPVPITLWPGLTAVVRLPVLTVLSIAIGFVPTYMVHRAKLWRLKRRIDNLERAAARAPTPTPSAAPGPVE